MSVAQIAGEAQAAQVRAGPTINTLDHATPQELQPHDCYAVSVANMDLKDSRVVERTSGNLRHSAVPEAMAPFDAAARAVSSNLWSLAASMFEDYVATAHGEAHRGAAYFNLALIRGHIGRYAEAFDYLNRAEKAYRTELDNPGRADTGQRDRSAVVSALRDCKERRIAYRLWQQRSLASVGCERVYPIAGGPVHGVLLATHHAKALFRSRLAGRQAMLAGLLQPVSEQHTELWIEQAYHDKNPMIGIMSELCGLVGVACLKPPSDIEASGSAALWYWIAQGHQRKGFGVQALEILKEIARRRGLRHVTARVRSENIPSQGALLKAGAVLMPTRTLDGAMHFVITL